MTPLLGVNLYEFLKERQFDGLSLTQIKTITKTLVDALLLLNKKSVVHGDIKPENILVNYEKGNREAIDVKLVDLGSGFFEGKSTYSYIQSRFYRSPEVILGCPYDRQIDIWSLGCVLAELFLGLPIFPGIDDYNQLCRMEVSLEPYAAHDCSCRTCFTHLLTN